MRDQMNEGNFARVTRARKHTLAKECRSKAYAIKPTYQVTFVPSFEAKAVTTAVQAVIEFQNRLIDPSFSPFANRCCAQFHDFAKGLVDRNGIGGGTNRAFEAARDMDLIQRQNSALVWINQKKSGIITPICHREGPARIACQKLVRAKALAHARVSSACSANHFSSQWML